MEAFCKIAPGVPKMANMLEGGGATPICSPDELRDMGFKVVAYPLSLLMASTRAMENTLRTIRDEGYPDESTLGTFEEIKDVIGFNAYYAEEDCTHSLCVANSGDDQSSKAGARATLVGTRSKQTEPSVTPSTILRCTS